MNDKENFRWIRSDIDISSFYDRLTDVVKELIAEAEEADRNDEEMVLYELQDSIENQAKLLVPDVISHKEWDMLCEKYYPAD